jgi:D-alanyl-D-alanine carboxypeptidase
VLLRTALAEPVVLDQALRKVVDRSSGYEANFVGLTHRQADLACARLQARSIQCFALSP